jgi:hypothetical protein
VFEFRSGLVDLVVCVRHHGGGGHRLTLAGERFVGRVTEDVAKVGDRGGATGPSGWGSSKNVPVLKEQPMSSRLAQATATSMDFDAPPSVVAVMRTEPLWRAAPRVNEKKHAGTALGDAGNIKGMGATTGGDMVISPKMG